MANEQTWQADKERYEAAWARFQQVADRVYEGYAEDDFHAQNHTAPEADNGELEDAWNELEAARQRIGERVNRYLERQMDEGKARST